MRRIVFREGVTGIQRRRALDVVEGWHVRALLVAPRTYHLTGQAPLVEAVVGALTRAKLIEVEQAGEA